MNPSGIKATASTPSSWASDSITPAMDKLSLETPKTHSIEEPISLEELGVHLRNLRDIEVLDLSLRLISPLDISCFAGCTKLSSLTLRVMQNSNGNPNAIIHFSQKLPSLTSLVISNAKIEKSFFTTVNTLRLRTLSLECCMLTYANDLDLLNSHPTLTHLDIRGTYALHEDLSKLFQRCSADKLLLPGVTVVSKPPKIDRRDYKNVLTPKGSPYAIRFQELAQYTCNSAQIAPIIYVQGAEEEENWQIHYQKVYAHNKCEGLIRGSPISSPDKRRRIASADPNKNRCEFWRHVLTHNISLIVMVKETSKNEYFPMKMGEKNQFGDITIVCTSQSLGPISERTFLVNDKKVHHLQIDWPDGKGIEVELLMQLLNRIFTLESDNPDSASIFHCLAGCGRTGTLFGALIIKWLLENTKELKGLSFDPAELVRALRQQRSGMIATSSQITILFKLVQTLAAKLIK